MIEVFYDRNPIQIRKIIKHLEGKNGLALGKHINYDVCDWDDQKIEDIFSTNLWQFVKNHWEFNEISKCYDTNPDKTRKIIKQLCNLGSPDIEININLDVLD